jgi:hypothetical protein
MINTRKVGTVYHVVDKNTGEVVKVGSTVCSLTKRWYGYNKQKYNTHLLLAYKILVSDDLDWYEPRNSDCPFVWHLIASEHMEMLRANTFRKGLLSNQQSPLDQKVFGFDALDVASQAGRAGGKVRSLSKILSCTARGKHNITSGLLSSICKQGGYIQGRRAAQSGQIAAVGKKQGRINASEIGRMEMLGKLAMHNRWHVKRGLVSPICKLCQAAA